MVVEDIPSTTLEKTNTQHIQNELITITQQEMEFPHKNCYKLLALMPLKSSLESVVTHT